jgi:hypothetical protein
MGFFSGISKLVPPGVSKTVGRAPSQLPNKGLGKITPPPVKKTPPPIVVEFLGNSRVVQGAHKSAVGLMVGGGALLLVGGKQMRGMIEDLTGVDLPILEMPGQLLNGALDGIEGLLMAAAGVAVTVGAAYVTWTALGDSPLYSRVAATGAASCAVGLAAAVTLENMN